MYHATQFYIGGRWVEPLASALHPVVDPSTGDKITDICLGGVDDVDRAVRAAADAFAAGATARVADRQGLFARIISVYERRAEEMAATISREMGAPMSIARGSHVPQGLAHLREAARLLETHPFETRRAGGLVVQEPIGVAALITPWNWPISLIACKVAPALAAGCTVVLKASEMAPLNAHLFAEILDEAGVPAGVFNLVDGDGPTVGTALAAHPLVDVVSITGSNRAGVAVAQSAAPTVKRVLQELGGKSACVVLDDADVRAVARDIATRVFRNSGQSCAALTRLLVPAARQADAVAGAREAAGKVVVGHPSGSDVTMGPVASFAQWERVQHAIRSGIAQGASVVAGGPGRPAGLERGCFVQPTVLSDVTEGMEIAQEEIFGPVLCIMVYDGDDDAVRIANGTRFGLSGAVRSADRERAMRIARRLRTGMVHVNETDADYGAPFGGYKQSGNGREWGEWGLAEYLETKMLFCRP